MAYNAVAQGDLDVYSDSASNHSASPVLPPTTMSRPLSFDYDHSPRPTRMSNASRGSYTPLQHPTPGLESLQGAYVSNIERLEQSAERLSRSGSDIGEELRKLRLEQKLSDSRRASLQSRHHDDDELPSPPSRQFSYPYGTHASNSIVGTNSIARSGGFSPSAYVASPRSSIHSGSRSQHNSIRGRSGSNPLRLTQLAEPEEEPRQTRNGSSFAPILPPPEASATVLRVVNHEEAGTEEIENAPPEQPLQPPDEATVDRPPSTDTLHQVNDLFEDFDGVHIRSQSPERSLHSNNEEGISIEQLVPGGQPDSLIEPFPDRPKSYMQPPSNENMVYYPAPVPMMLNLPQRLSKLPPAPFRDKRRSEVLSGLQPEARKSAPWLPHPLGEEYEEPSVIREEEPLPRKSEKRRPMADLPPQLRASVFFDYPSVHQEVELKDGSAIATLDSILDASAYAPVSAFTDHPIAGRVGPEVYGRANRVSNIPPGLSGNRKRGSSLNLLRRNSNSNILNETRLRTSSMMSLGNIGKRKSSIPLANDEAAAASLHSEETPLHVADETLHLGGIDKEEDEFQDAQLEQDSAEEVGSDEEIIGQPTTLLAELLLRKKQQKQRNRQAAIAFPNGMHSTLLEMDAVAQVQKRTREKRHVQLAWEDPNGAYGGVEEEDDDDVPLGMLYPTQKLKPSNRFGRNDEDRPLGLIARRHLEDNETLSQRRARLKGIVPNTQNTDSDRLASMYTLDMPVSDNREQPHDPDEVEGETLAQRLKRRKNKQPNPPVNVTSSRTISGDFASEVLSQFGGLEAETSKEKAAKPPLNDTTSTMVSPKNNSDAPVEETLGQRRRRLQAEREARARDASSGSIVPPPAPTETERPAASKRRSMADILSVHPAAGAGSRITSNEKTPPDSAPPPARRQTSWAQTQQRKFSSNGGGMPMAAGTGIPNPLAYKVVNENAPLSVGGIDARKGDMIDRWRQSVLY